MNRVFGEESMRDAQIKMWCWHFQDDCESIETGQTITKGNYAEILCRQKDAVRRKWKQFWASGDVTDTFTMTMHLQILRTWYMNSRRDITSHGFYRPDLAPSYFCLFLMLKY